MACSEFECLICPACCKEKSTAEPAKSTADPKLKTKPGKRIQTEAQMADATIVYVLGSLEGETDKQVDEYSGLNGFHIRTIPGRRWATPIMVGAGAGYLAVVDRFQDFDLIRVTDKYGGAGTAGFDTDGFPLDSVDWANIPDLCTIPAGGRVTGLKITPHGVLIAHLAGTSTYLKLDIQSRATGGLITAALEGIQQLPAPFDTLGSIIGTPVFVNANVGPHMFYTMALVKVANGGYIVIIIDTLQNKVVGLQGLPTSPAPISATLSNSVMSVLCGDNGIGSQIIRFVVDFAGGGILAGTVSDKTTPTPQDYTVNQYPEMKDLDGRTFDPTQLHAYYEAAAEINETANAKNRVIPTTFADLPPINQDSNVLNDNRVSVSGFIVSQYYNQSIQVPSQIIAVDATLGLKALESGYGTTTEMFHRQTGGMVDRTKPVFRVLHGGHYDIVADGGYTYGTGSVGITNGMIGDSIATDKDYELGKLKFVDAKAALVDAATGLFLYREPKPQNGYRVYGGDYAALDPVQDNSALEVELLALQDDITRLHVLYDGDDPPNAELQAAEQWQSTLNDRLTALKMTAISVVRTQATLAAENAVMAVDGVQRSVVSPWESPWLIPARTVTNGEPIAAFSTPGCADDYWSLFIREPGVANQFDATLMRRNWSTNYTDPITGDPTLFPEWAESNISPIQVASQTVNTLVPWRDPTQPSRYPMLLNAVGRGGFFSLGLPYVTMSNVDRYNEEAASLANLNDDYQRVVNDPTSSPVLVAQYAGYIAENNARVAYISTVPFWGTLPIVPRNILGMKFHKLNKSVGQVAPYIPEDMVIDPTILPGLTPGDTISVGTVAPTLKRGCVINAGPWAFVAVKVRLTADDIQDGVNVYSNPEARRNGLGIKIQDWVWPPDQENAFDVVGGSFYEAGYRCSPFGGTDAWGTWGYSIQGDAPLISIDDLPLGQRELFVSMLAPSDAQSLLLEDINNDEGDNIDAPYQRSHYFLTQAPLHSITVKFWLRHHATDVFRWGWMTESHNYPRTAGQLCYTIDPGFNTGLESILEAPGCGGTLSDLGLGHLFPTDPTYPQLGHDVVLGAVVFTCAANPYTALGLAYGTIWKCDIEFDLNNNLRALDVPLLPSDVEKPGV